MVGTISWDDEGISCEHEEGVTEWEINLKPGETVRKKLIGYPGAACNLTPNLHLEEHPDSPEEFAQIIKKTGTLSKVYMEGVKRPYDVNVYNGSHAGKYYFVFDNRTNYIY